MQIQNIKLENFRGFKKQSIELFPNINVFVGVNGAGKSTILDAIAISLSWLVEGIQKTDSRGMNIPDGSIKNDTNFSSIALEVLEKNRKYSWKNIEFKRGYPADEKFNFHELDKLVYYYQTKYQKDNTLPMIAYYPINRIAKGISGLYIHGRENIAQLDVYDNALGSKANFQAFFEWFRLQDDIINEQAQSRSKWMRQNRKWVKSKLDKALNTLGDSEVTKRFSQRLEDDNFLLDEPRILFFELMDIIHSSNRYDKNTRKDLHEIEYLLHRMSRLIDRGEDESVESNSYFYEIEKIFKHIFYFQEDKKYLNNNIIHFVWEVLLFYTELYFWKITSKGKKDIERIFNNFNPWEKNKKLNFDAFSKKIKMVIEEDKKRLKQALFNEGKELKIVTKTIEKFIPEYSNIRVTRIPTPHMLVEKNGETIRLDQLSDGEKNMIAMVGDIARRLSMANPRMKNPLEGDGIVLIDEIDLHLHPLWQRVIVSRLTEVFPKCQFIVSTHSPQVLSHLKAEHIFILKPTKDDVSIEKPTESYGKSTDRQLEDILGVASRPPKIKEDLRRLYMLIHQKELTEAKELLQKLGQVIEGSEPELVKADVLIKRKEMLGK